jgi:hypothetical protein
VETGHQRDAGARDHAAAAGAANVPLLHATSARAGARLSRAGLPTPSPARRPLCPRIHLLIKTDRLNLKFSKF